MKNKYKVEKKSQLFLLNLILCLAGNLKIENLTLGTELAMITRVVTKILPKRWEK